MNEDQPRLCPDHAPVINAAAHLEHVGDNDVANARAERARQCPQCHALNDGSRR